MVRIDDTCLAISLGVLSVLYARCVTFVREQVSEGSRGSACGLEEITLSIFDLPQRKREWHVLIAQQSTHRPIPAPPQTGYGDATKAAHGKQTSDFRLSTLDSRSVLDKWRCRYIIPCRDSPVE
jgi:hypothetical protein